MKTAPYNITGKVWLYPGESASWHFLTIPKTESSAITNEYKAFKKGWGSLPILVTIGKTTWNTSIFPDTKSGTYILPLKALVRKKEDIAVGDSITCIFKIMRQGT